MNDREYVMALEKGLAVLRAFQPEDRGPTIGQVAKRTGIGRQNVRRILMTLEALGYMDRPTGGDRLWNREAFYPTSHVLVLVRCIGVVPLDPVAAAKADAEQVAMLLPHADHNAEREEA